jgi:hypothetical protein
MFSASFIIKTIVTTAVALLAACFVYGFAKETKKGLRDMKTIGPLTINEARTLCSAMLMITWLSLISIGVLVVLFMVVEAIPCYLFWTYLAIVVIFNVYICHRGRSRLRSSLERGGYGPEFMRNRP